MEETAETDRCETRLAVSGVAKRLGEAEGDLEGASGIDDSTSTVMMGQMVKEGGFWVWWWCVVWW